MSSLFGTSPFQQVPTVGQPQGPPAVDTHTFSMPFETGNTHAFGPSPEVSPSPSRANSVRHGSAEQDSHRDVFGRRMGEPTGTPATSRSHSRVNSPRPFTRVRSTAADAEEEDRHRAPAFNVEVGRLWLKRFLLHFISRFEGV